MYYILPEKFQNTILIIFSLFFYIYGDVKFLPLLLITGIVNYFLSRKIRNKSVLIVGIILNILPLLYFKYTNFIIDIINSITSFNIDLFDLILPLGISFTTFRMISFLIDAHNNKIKVIYKDLKTKKNFTSEEYDTVLLAIGRTPNTSKLNLDKIGVKVDKRTKKILKMTYLVNLQASGNFR